MQDILSQEEIDLLIRAASEPALDLDRDSDEDLPMIPSTISVGPTNFPRNTSEHYIEFMNSFAALTQVTCLPNSATEWM